MTIKGIENLSEEQQKLMNLIHEKHVASNGSERKKNMAITETWIDESGVVCVRLENDEWYHYYPDGTWA